MWFTNVLNKPFFNIFSSREGTTCFLVPDGNRNQETEPGDGNRSGGPAGRVTGQVKILRPAGQAG